MQCINIKACLTVRMVEPVKANQAGVLKARQCRRSNFLYAIVHTG